MNELKKRARPQSELEALAYIEATKTFVINGQLVQESSLSEKDATEFKKKAKKMSFITEASHDQV